MFNLLCYREIKNIPKNQSMMIKRIFTVLLLWVLVTPAIAQPSQTTFSFSLQQCIDYALQNQHDVVNAQISEGISHRQVQEITAVGLPQINGSGTFNDFLYIN